jgi:hypothetical protein
MSAPNPQEAWQRIQTELTRRTQRFGGPGGGAPKGFGPAVAAIVVLGGGFLVANNALFNGTYSLDSIMETPKCILIEAKPGANGLQWTVVIAQSSTLG